MTLTESSTRSTPRVESTTVLPVLMPRPLASRLAQRQTPGDDDQHLVTIACQTAIATAAPQRHTVTHVAPEPFDLGLVEHPTIPDYWLDDQCRDAIRAHGDEWSVYLGDEHLIEVPTFPEALVLWAQLSPTLGYQHHHLIQGGER